MNRRIHFSDRRSHGGKDPSWMKQLRNIDSTSISQFYNLNFNGERRQPKNGKKKDGIKVPAVIQANEGVPFDIRFTSAVKNDSFILKPSCLRKEI